MKKIHIFETPFDTYTSLDIIGEGGSGRVYLVSNNAGEKFALKCLTPNRITSDRLKRFKNEILFCQRQNHPNIIKVIDTGIIITDDVKCPFYVMNFFSGTLRTIIGKLQPDEIMKVFSQILDGVEAAHLTKVWHRDLKPENILYEEKRNRIIIADFGIAHFEEEEIYIAVETKSTERLANFQYSAPEQRTRNSSVDYRADIFSLGLILNELFTGEILQGAGHKKISDINSNYAYLDDIVDLMIQQNPSNRPPSIEKIKLELIGRKNSFISLQKYNEIKDQVVSAKEIPEFDPVKIVSMDYHTGLLVFYLNRDIPHGWTELFKNPYGGHSAIMGYGPQTFNIHGNTISVKVRDDQKFIQTITDHTKNYINAANNRYIFLLREQTKEKAEAEKAELERKIAEAEMRKNILSNIKI